MWFLAFSSSVIYYILYFPGLSCWTFSLLIVSLISYRISRVLKFFLCSLGFSCSRFLCQTTCFHTTSCSFLSRFIFLYIYNKLKLFLFNLLKTIFPGFASLKQFCMRYRFAEVKQLTLCKCNTYGIILKNLKSTEQFKK